jgi:endonuclease-3 related protein
MPRPGRQEVRDRDPHAADRPDLSRRLGEIYDLLFAHFGPQHWWPAETPFEVAVGAILTQNTNWRNVERAVGNLKDHGVLSLSALHTLSADELSALIRPSGYHTVKAKRLKEYVAYLMDRYGGDLAASLTGAMDEKRAELLSVRGIGPETADSILLYAGGRPTFVVDAYTRRIAARHGLAPADAGYEALRSLFMQNLPPDPVLWGEYHALFVALGKTCCRSREPRCEGCPLSGILDRE